MSRDPLQIDRAAAVPLSNSDRASTIEDAMPAEKLSSPPPPQGDVAPEATRPTKPVPALRAMPAHDAPADASAPVTARPAPPEASAVVRAKPAPPEVSGIVATTRATREAADHAIAARQATKARLLIVDDEPAITKALAKMLAPSYEVTIASDGMEAADRLVGDSFDIVLSDIRLPTMSGVDLLRLVRAHDSDVPVLLMTGQPSLETAMAAVDLGALTYITKPFEPEALKTALERAERLSRLAKAKREALSMGVGSPLAGDRAGLEAAFARAMESLWIAYQPIVDARTKRTVAFEALMRTDEPSMKSPVVVLEAAERLGEIRALGRRVRRRIAESFAAPRGDELLFVNLHAGDLEDPDLASPGAPLAHLAPRVVFEVTERASLDSVRDVRALMARLRDAGYRIALDDIGAGYSGLASFATLEPEIVKLDMSLVRGIEKSPVRYRIVESITTLCRELSIKVVAEGIETPGELGRILELKCDLLQGYYLGRPEREIAASGRSF